MTGLFYRFDNEVPTDFHELRQFGNSLWTANGKVKTMGRSTVAEFASPQAARDALAQRGQEIEAQGYKLTRQGIHDPARIDFPLLATEIREGARRAFQAIRAAHPGETVRFVIEDLISAAAFQEPGRGFCRSRHSLGTIPSWHPSLR
ncbi:putative DNA-binding WGR domain protein [Variovorax boronicumulans]|uniref:hypothetical protein n=1 Tax=Variovorax boronicumulans TaxID=436515 RepID=UPI002780513E|nr:hypothetical protein [Variovorax boronicumulans]MDQ0036721.1 putative DNA-binding WGR domain protein [Variovorax boronicumulans]